MLAGRVAKALLQEISPTGMGQTVGQGGGFFATLQEDVHEISKNVVNSILSCNGPCLAKEIDVILKLGGS
jgi:cobalamin-dependent methionine synthase I